MDKEIVNKVAQSPLVSIDLKEFYPTDSEYVLIDIADYLYERLILKEKDFRQALKNIDYSKYKDKYVGIFCSEDAIIPQWAYLLFVIHLHPFAKKVFWANENELIQKIILHKIEFLNLSKYEDKPVVIKGCSDVKISIEAYMLLVDRLINVAKSVMYGEPCSTVPLYKRKV